MRGPAACAARRRLPQQSPLLPAAGRRTWGGAHTASRLQSLGRLGQHPLAAGLLSMLCGESNAQHSLINSSSPNQSSTHPWPPAAAPTPADHSPSLDSVPDSRGLGRGVRFAPSACCPATMRPSPAATPIQPAPSSSGRRKPGGKSTARASTTWPANQISPRLPSSEVSSTSLVTS